MQFNQAELSTLVEKVLTRLQTEGPSGGGAPAVASVTSSLGRGVFRDMDQAIDAARAAQLRLAQTTLEQRSAMVANIRKRLTERVRELAELAVSETGLGRVEDKIKKNLLVLRKTPGPEILKPTAWTGDDGLTLMERAPYGVIGSITPSTNPTETILSNGIGMFSGANTIVFNSHPGARKVSLYCIQLINDAIVEAGGPENCFTSVVEPTLQSAEALMKHKGLRLLVVTGGPAVVRAAMASGKKVIAGGPGNPPVVVDETADLDAAGKGIVAGASLDNNIICCDEKEVFVVHSVADKLIESMRRAGAYLASPYQVKRLEQLVVQGDHPHKDWVGKDARKILAAIDVQVNDDPRLIICETDARHPFVQIEMLMPVLPIVRVRNVDEGIALAIEAEHGYGHTASMWSKNIDHLHKMARVINTSIFVKNAPHFAGLGLGGEGHTSFTIASPTGEGLTTALHFTRERRCTLSGHFRIV
ncbi:MAG: aldehyde dehydrogenase family protein [Myxococcota bacterium]